MFNIIKEKKEKEIKFPVIAKRKKNNEKVLFFNEKVGVLIQSDICLDDVGYAVFGFDEVSKGDAWEILHTDVKINLIVSEEE